MAETLMATADLRGTILVQNDVDEVLHELSVGGPVLDIAMGMQQETPHLVATVRTEGTYSMQAWNLNSGQALFSEKQAVLTGQDCEVSLFAPVELLKRGQWLYSITQNTDHSLGLRRLDSGTGKPMETLSLPGGIALDDVRTIGMVASGHELYAGASNGVVYKWNLGEIAESNAPRKEIWLPSYRYTARRPFGAPCLAQRENGDIYATDATGALHYICGDELVRTVYANDQQSFYRDIAVGRTAQGQEVLATVRESGSVGRTSLLSVLPAEVADLAESLLDIPSIREKGKQRAVHSRTVDIADLQGERCVLSGGSDGFLYAWRLPENPEQRRKPDIIYDRPGRTAVHAMAVLSVGA